MSTVELALATPMRRNEIADRLGRHAAPPQPRQRRHARIVPPLDALLRHQLGQKAFRQHGITEIEPREFILPRPRRHRQIVEQPVVKRPVILEFQRADRMGHALDRVRLAVGEIVGGIDAPCLAGARMFGVQNAVEHRVAQIDVARRHVDLGAQHPRAVGELARAHAAEEIEVFLHAAPAPSALAARLGQACRARLAARPPACRRHRPCRGGSDARPSRKAARNNPRRDRGTGPNRIPASARRARSRRCIPALPWSGWCRRSADGSARRNPWRCRNSGRSTWRGRYGDSRWARAESASPAR